MAYNILSGNVSDSNTSVNLSGTFSGSYSGDGAQIVNVSHVTQDNPAAGRIPYFYGSANADNEYNFQGDSDFTFDSATRTFTTKTGSFSHVSIREAQQGTGSYLLGINSSNQIILTSSSGGGGSLSIVSGSTTSNNVNTLRLGDGLILNEESSGVAAISASIGSAEDGDYTDGLYTDFTPQTPVGIPIDRFNEIFKILAPTPAPSVRRINELVTDGITAKLSFGSAYPVSGYASSATTAGFTAVGRSGSYGPATSGNNIRLGIYKNDTNINGKINFDVAESVTNGNVAYASGAFGNAETGDLKLELNGTVIHTTDLSSFTGAGNPATGSGSDLNSSGSGFQNVSVTASSFDGNGSEWYIFKHRTADYIIDSSSMRAGWNYARVVHTIASTDYTTNYIEWINDPSGAVGVEEMSASNGRIEDITLLGSKYLSGVQYNTGSTANYKVNLLNLYTNVYSTAGNEVSFTVTNSTTPSNQSVPDIGVSETANKILGVTGSLEYNGNSLLSGSITSNVSVTHPLKQTISNTGSATTGIGFLIDDRTLASTNRIEYFHDESYRKTSGSYDNQSDTTSSTSVWNSENHMTGGGAAGHTDGLLFYNQRLYSPVDGDIPVGGDFSSLNNVESGQPDYSGVTGTRTFYRILSNSSGGDVYNVRIRSSKVGTSYNNSALGTSNVHFFIKNPGTTGWMDISQNFTYGNIGDNDGAKVTGTDTDTYISFGTASVPNGENMMIKIIADSSWSGYISQLTLDAPGETGQATPNVLNDIDANDAGSSAKLSFGASNAISGYSNATISTIGGSDIDSNGAYSLSGDRRGIFTSAPIIDGALNDNKSAGTGFPADAFFNGYSGSLILEVNGSDVHEVVISGTLNAISNNFNGNSSGFDLSAVNFSTTNNVPDYNKPYRTGTYQIGAGDQRTGWNYARVKHGGTTTNYVEWVIDPSGAVDNTAVSTPVLSNFNHGTPYYQSGIAYFSAAPSGTFDFSGSNFYSNVYSNSSTAIRFPTTTNASITNIRITGSGVTTFNSAVSSTGMPALNNTADCETTDIQITGSVLYNGTIPSISGGLGLFTDQDVTVAGQIRNHPFKSNRTTTSASKTSFMIYSGSISAGVTNSGSNEDFNVEEYRIVSGNYANQSDVTSSSNTWDSTVHMTGSGTHADGMVTANGFLISPLKIGNAGDTRNTADGGSLQAPAGNPNYSSITEVTRSYYRYFKNTSGLTVQNFNLFVTGNAEIVAKQGAVHFGALGSNNRINLELKVPFDPAFSGLDDRSTAWGDCAIPQGGVDPSTDGDGIFNGGNGNLDQDASNGSNIAITLGTKEWKANQLIVLKISAHKDWTGYLTNVTASY